MKGSGAPERTWTLTSGRPKPADEARRFAELTVDYCDAEDRRATAMAVSEFAENLIKYGGPNPGSGGGAIAISVNPKVIRIRVTNQVVTTEDAATLQDTISRIAGATDVGALYQNRLAALFQNPCLPRARLGLLRVAFEGGFRLSCSFDPPLVEIVAERNRAGTR